MEATRHNKSSPGNPPISVAIGGAVSVGAAWSLSTLRAERVGSGARLRAEDSPSESKPRRALC